MRGVVAGVIALASVATAVATEPRFFVAGEGTFAIGSVFTKAPVTVAYRREDGTYDPDALATLRRVLRSKDGREGPITPRVAELLGYVYVLGDRKPLRVMSGYRSPTYNDAIRKKGAKAASASMHTEGLAIDLTFPKPILEPLWQAIRALECCGAGYYAGNGFLHLDVGRPRFWEAATSRVDENLSAGNARVFARSEYDRYAAGEPIIVTLHAVTEPPIRIAATVTVKPSEGPQRSVALDVAREAPEGCLAIDATGTRLTVPGTTAAPRATLIFTTCEPRPGATPPTIETNPLEVR